MRTVGPGTYNAPTGRGLTTPLLRSVVRWVRVEWGVRFLFDVYIPVDGNDHQVSLPETHRRVMGYIPGILGTILA